MRSPSDVAAPGEVSALFDLADEYEAMLSRGLKLTGESREFFMRGRISAVLDVLGDERIDRVLDFGCGTGETSAHLSKAFDGAWVVGVDTAEGALAHARHEHDSPNVRFCRPEHVRPGSFDLCYVNGVFHHIEPADRPRALCTIRDALRPGGWFAFFENNPWNLGTRVIMSRVPFDKEARLISPSRARRTLRSAGFEVSVPNQFLFFFPRSLCWLRRLERVLGRVPLGGQYLTLVRKPLA